MYMKHLILLLLISTFVACSSAPKRVDKAEVAVEDQSAGLTEEEQTLPGAESFGTETDGYSDISELDDPESPLSNRTIRFGYDSSEVRTKDREILDKHAEYLASSPNTTITLEGHADETGSREYNLALGERRAYAVSKYMGIFGVAPNQVRIITYGEERPAVEGHDEAAWAQNRRVEIIY